jgi:hypothetical protein
MAVVETVKIVSGNGYIIINKDDFTNKDEIFKVKDKVKDIVVDTVDTVDTVEKNEKKMLDTDEEIVSNPKQRQRGKKT